MDELEVQIIHLEPIQVASTYSFGETPEWGAMETLLDWAAGQGLLAEKAAPIIYGFNNPSPMEGSPNYGYETWMVIDPQTVNTEGVALKSFPGGLYAVTRVIGVENIFPTWQRLVAWLESSPYQPAKHQWLEQHVKINSERIDEYVVDLFLPIQK